MYILDRHMPPDDESILELIRQFPLGCIVRQVNGELVADHIPLLLSAEGVVLRGHVAAANPLAGEPDASGVFVIFSGPESYISPSWCDSKKRRRQDRTDVELRCRAYQRKSRVSARRTVVVRTLAGTDALQRKICG